MKKSTSDLERGELRFWQRRTDRTLTVDDAREIRSNLAGYFPLLATSDRRIAANNNDEEGGKR